MMGFLRQNPPYLLPDIIPSEMGLPKPFPAFVHPRGIRIQPFSWGGLWRPEGQTGTRHH